MLVGHGRPCFCCYGIEGKGAYCGCFRPSELLFFVRKKSVVPKFHMTLTPLIPLLVEINLSKIVTGIKSQIAFTFTATKLSLWAEEPDISN